MVQTHDRAQTEALLIGLPQQPLKRLGDSGKSLFEMDVDGILARPPASCSSMIRRTTMLPRTVFQA
ncbi:two-component sensor KdpD [Stutzerimonas stutzeri TS44]|nr:two-component sensor KdpD [Stutzerimonas stutzeri TS44]